MSAGQKQINPYEVAVISLNPSAEDIWEQLCQEERQYELFEWLVDECKRASSDVLALKHDARDEILFS